jgi:hypothetical protein
VLVPGNRLDRLERFEVADNFGSAVDSFSLVEAAATSLSILFVEFAADAVVAPDVVAVAAVDTGAVDGRFAALSLEVVPFFSFSKSSSEESTNTEGVVLGRPAPAPEVTPVRAEEMFANGSATTRG